MRVKELHVNVAEIIDLSQTMKPAELDAFQKLLQQLASEIKEYNCNVLVFAQGVRLTESTESCSFELGPLVSHYLCTRSSKQVASFFRSVRKIEFGTWRELAKRRGFRESKFVHDFHSRYSRIHQVSYIKTAPDQEIHGNAFLDFLDTLKDLRITHLEFGSLALTRKFYQRLSERCDLARSVISFRLFDDNAYAISFDFEFLFGFHCLRFFATNVITRGLTLELAERLANPITLELYFKPKNVDGHVLCIEKVNRNRCKVTITNRSLKRSATSPDFTEQREIPQLDDLEQFLVEFEPRLQNSIEDGVES